MVIIECDKITTSRVRNFIVNNFIINDSCQLIFYFNKKMELPSKKVSEKSKRISTLA